VLSRYAFRLFMLPLLPAAASAASFDPIVFELVKGSGIDFVTNSSRSAHRHQPETMVAGIALFELRQRRQARRLPDERREDDRAR
jgi:hypothetical protein